MIISCWSVGTLLIVFLYRVFVDTLNCQQLVRIGSAKKEIELRHAHSQKYWSRAAAGMMALYGFFDWQLGHYGWFHQFLGVAMFLLAALIGQIMAWHELVLKAMPDQPASVRSDHESS